MNSVLQKNKECYFCGTTNNLEEHHCLHGWANRRLSEKDGLKVWLCNYHHTGSNEAVHNNPDADLFLKKMAQEYYERNIGTRQQFIQRYGRNYL